MPSLDFQKICRDMSNLSENLDIKSIGKQLIFSCKGDYATQDTIVLPFPTAKSIPFICHEMAHNKYLVENIDFPIGNISLFCILENVEGLLVKSNLNNLGGLRVF